MKLITILQGRDALAKLTETPFTSYKTLRELVRLKKRVDEEYEFYSTQEKRAVDTYADKTEDGQLIFVEGGRLKLKDAQAKLAFDAELTKLNETEIEDIPAVTIRESDFKAAEMLLLSAFINFEED